MSLLSRLALRACQAIFFLCAAALFEFLIVAGIGHSNGASIGINLDSITSTQGDMLFRGASTWKALHCTTAGQVPVFGGASTDVGCGYLPAGPVPPIPTSSGTGLTTWGNQGTASVSDASNGVQMVDTGTNAVAHALRFRYESVPSTPYTLTALVYPVPVPIPPLGGTVNSGCMIGWRQSSSSKLETIDIIWNNGTAYKFGVYKWSSYTAFTSADYDGTSSITPIEWLRLNDDGTNLNFSVSTDGIYFITLFTVAASSSYFSGHPDQVGFIIDPSGSYMACALASWKQS